jgi:hypothetical protein
VAADELEASIKRFKTQVIDSGRYLNLPQSPDQSEWLAALCPLQWHGTHAQEWLPLMDHIYHTWVRDGVLLDAGKGGIRPTLALNMAHAFRVGGDGRAAEILERNLAISGPTYRWPDLVHPLTLGGTGAVPHDVSAAAAYIGLLRELYVSEDSEHGELWLFSGVPARWWQGQGQFKLAGVQTCFGLFGIRVDYSEKQLRLTLSPRFFVLPEKIRIFLPGPAAHISAGEFVGNQLVLPADTVYVEVLLQAMVFS